MVIGNKVYATQTVNVFAREGEQLISEWRKPEEGKYCGKYTKVITYCTDAAAIASVMGASLLTGPGAAISGLTLRTVSVTNGVVTAMVCGGISPSTATTGLSPVQWTRH